ncbi:MAG: hypothetical protein JO142_19380 [Burkholderiales bacterium]|nr:hypothetical protein [Burkholderiales bacterium]
MHPGTQQNQRLPDGLRPDYFLPDELDLPKRIGLSLAQAASLRFIDQGTHDAGRWDEALLRDETIALSDLVAFPIEQVQTDFMQVLPWADEASLWNRICQLMRRYDLWCQHLLEAELTAVRTVGEAMVGMIVQGLSELFMRASCVWPWASGALHSAWLATPAPEEAAALVAALTHIERRQLLRRTWLGLCQAIIKLQPIARAQIDASMRTGQHDPAMSLLLATLQMVQYSRAPLNRFPERLTEFYFHDVLHMRPRPPATERVHLLLERDARFAGAVRIDAGARFAGGKDASGAAIEFAAEQALDVTDARVVALHTLRIERDALISPEREFAYATRLKSEALPTQAPEAAYQIRPAWWPLLGGRAKHSAAQSADASLGLAVASPLLTMREGHREIRLGLQLVHPADDDDHLRTLLRQTGDARNVDWLAAVFARYTDFSLQYFPPRSRAGKAEPALDHAAMAAAACTRSAVFEDDVRLCYLVACCLATQDAGVFSERLGRLFAAWLAAAHEDIRLEDLAALRTHGATLMDLDEARTVEIDDPLILIHAPRRFTPNHANGNGHHSHARPDRVLIFDRVLTSVWQARLSSTTGWIVIDSVFTQRRVVEKGAGVWGGSVEIVLRLGPDQPPLVPCQAALHGTDWPAQTTLQLCMQTKARMYAYDLLQQWILQDMTLDVAVSGLRDVVLYNQLGRLDPSKPFHPFGPAPGRSAYLVLGSQELATKSLQALRLNVKWSGLPDGPGGFVEHYHGYGGPWSNDGFRLRTSVLMDGKWHTGGAQTLPMFRSQQGGHHLDPANTLTLPSADLRRWHRAIPPTNGQQFQYDLHSRNGFFRFDLTEPAGGFGHADYASLLTAVLTHNARSKVPKPVPKEPYTPVIEHLTVDYQASQSLPLGQDGQDAGGAAVFQLHPFGLQPIHTAYTTRHPGLLPRYASDGNLYIGLECSEPQGALSLFFHLRKEEAAERWREAQPQLQWAVWCDSGWQVLKPFQLLSDGTQGMLCSGIVQLNLPGGMSRQCPQLPGDAYWIRLSAAWGFDQLAGLYGVHTQAIRAARVKPAGPEEPLAPLAPLPLGTINAAMPSIPGLRTISQVGPSFGRQGADPESLLLIRSAERLRHKQRAVTVWDYERLLLDAFPEVCKVKCFAHHLPTRQISGEVLSDSHVHRPGHVLVVVVPAPHQGSLFSATEAPRLDAERLATMTAYLRERAPAGLNLVVRNVAYERIQVRCNVRLVPGSHPGTALRQLNQTLVEYLSPWHELGYGACFDWQIDGEALEAHLRAHPSVAAVGALSLLHVVCSDDRFYVLRDTARTAPHQPENPRAAMRKVKPEQPWSLALPMRHHLIELADEPAAQAPRATGLVRLEVGNTFIVGRSGDPGKA